jgi:hypothetical protein
MIAFLCILIVIFFLNFQKFYFFLLFGDKILLCKLGWPLIHDPLALVSQVGIRDMCPNAKGYLMHFIGKLCGLISYPQSIMVLNVFHIFICGPYILFGDYFLIGCLFLLMCFEKSRYYFGFV